MREDNGSPSLNLSTHFSKIALYIYEEACALLGRIDFNFSAPRFFQQFNHQTLITKETCWPYKTAAPTDHEDKSRQASK